MNVIDIFSNIDLDALCAVTGGSGDVPCDIPQSLLPKLARDDVSPLNPTFALNHIQAAVEGGNGQWLRTDIRNETSKFLEKKSGYQAACNYALRQHLARGK